MKKEQIKKSKKFKSKESSQESSQESSLFLKLEKDITEIFKKIDQFDLRLKNIETLISNAKQEQKDGELSKNRLLKILKDVYNSTGKLTGNFVPISTITKKIKEQMSWDTEKIYKELYDLYIKEEIHLLPGKSSNEEPFIQDGKSFAWFKLVD